jgi:hypothetical protein
MPAAPLSLTVSAAPQLLRARRGESSLERRSLRRERSRRATPWHSTSFISEKNEEVVFTPIHVDVRGDRFSTRRRRARAARWRR